MSNESKIKLEEAPDRFPFNGELFVHKGHRMFTLEWSEICGGWFCPDLPRVPRHLFKNEEEIKKYFENISEFV